MRAWLERINPGLLFSLGCIFAVQIYFVMSTARLHRLREDRLSHLASFMYSEATWAYETGGTLGLAMDLKRMATQLGAEAFLLDPLGHDLVNAADRAALLHANTTAFFGLLDRQTVRVFRGGKYTLVFFVPKSERELFLADPTRIVIPILIICYGYAALFAVRMRRLEKTLAQFAAGDFSARIRPLSRDAIGRVYQTFNVMAERIQTLLQSERRLFMDLSHELRSPLTRLGVALKLARIGKDRDGALDQVQRECVRLNGLITDILQLAHAEIDPAARHLERIDMAALSTELIAQCAIEAREKRCRIQGECDAAPVLFGDRDLIRSAVENVLRNAIRHSPPDACVELAVREENGHCVVSIRDYGNGVPEGALREIFKPFYRVNNDRRRETGGVGLGLAIAERAVVLHSGNIWAENAQPGLRMTLAIPIVGTADGDAAVGR